MNKTALTKDNQLNWYLLFTVWLIAACGTLTSLFFSEIVKVPVCVLCWYQRIALYPLVLILPLGLFPYDSKIIRYAGILAITGWLIALYHVLLVAGIIPETAQPCVQGIPCSDTHVQLLGFLSIPVMSFILFSLIGSILGYTYLKIKRNNYE